MFQNLALLMKLDAWLKRKPKRSWDGGKQSSTIIGGKTLTDFYTVRLKEEGKIVSVGGGPNADTALKDALDSLPKVYK